MKERATRQLESASLTQIRDILQQSADRRYDRLSVEDAPFKRANFMFVSYRFQVAQRTIQLLQFPLYPAAIVTFARLEGGVATFGTRSPLAEGVLAEMLKGHTLQPRPFSGEQTEVIMDFPPDFTGEDISPQQNSYFIPSLTYQRTCETCDGDKYVTCRQPDCRGRHEYTCPQCHGSRKEECSRCKGSGKKQCSDCEGRGKIKCATCRGSKEISCWRCFRTGYISVGGNREVCRQCHGRGSRPCPDCENGFVNCTTCYANGFVDCPVCHGQRKVDCRTCGAAGVVICRVCYGDEKRYGKVDCPVCEAIGTVGQVVFVTTRIDWKEGTEIKPLGDTIAIGEDKILTCIDPAYTRQRVYKRNAGSREAQYDDYSLVCAAGIEKSLGVAKEGFPMVTQEEIYYEVVPCVEVTGKHIFTGQPYTITVVGLWSAPKFLYDKDPLLPVEEGFWNTAPKEVGKFFGRLFDTTEFKNNEDKKKEIRLYILLLRSGNRPSDQRKRAFSLLLSGLDKLTGSDRRELFDLLNVEKLPSLSRGDCHFHFSANRTRTLANLEKLAATEPADPEGVAFVELVKNMKA